MKISVFKLDSQVIFSLPISAVIIGDPLTNNFCMVNMKQCPNCTFYSTCKRHFFKISNVNYQALKYLI